MTSLPPGPSAACTVLTSSSPPRPSAASAVLTSSSPPGPSTPSAVLTSFSPPGPSTASAVLTSSSAGPSTAPTVLTSSSPPGPSTASAVLPSSSSAGPSTASAVLTSSSSAGPSTASAVLTSSSSAGPSTASAVLPSSSSAGPSTASAVLPSSSSAGPSTASAVLPNSSSAGPSTASAILTSSSSAGPSTASAILTSSSSAGPSTASAVLPSSSSAGPSTASAVLTSSSSPVLTTTSSSSAVPSTASTVLTRSSSAGPSTISSALSGPLTSVHAGSGSNLHISDNQKRWVVVGISMHLVLLPAVLNVVRQEISQFYKLLKNSKKIDTQVCGAHMKKDGSFLLNYDSINNNKKGKMYDYRVTSAEDLGKLYLQPHMAKFTGFDNTCDLSAVLGILANASVFETSVQDNAKKVRSQVRNEWGHCNFDHWDELEFTNCFKLMKTLISSLKLPTADEKKIYSGLLEWEINGLQLCMDGLLNKHLVKLVSDQVAHLECGVKLLRESSADEAMKISDALQNVRCEFDNCLADLCERMEEQNKLFSNAMRDMSTDISQLKSRHDDLQASLSSIKDNCNVTNSSKAVAFQVPSRNPYFCGRNSELRAISSHLKVTESGCGQSAICGLGGVGKTSLTVEFLWRCKEEFKGGIFWISGESNTLFQNSFCELAHQLETYIENDFPSTLSRTLDLLQREDQLWCLVVDNLDEPDLSEELHKLLRGKWKQRARGQIIVTTRREARQVAEVAGIEERCCVVLDCLTEEDSIQFLRKRTEIVEEEDSEIREMIEVLGALPLALDQAAAYIKCVRCSLKDYVKQYKKKKLVLLKRKKARDVEENTSRERLAAHTTWLMNFEHIKSNPSYEKNLREAANLVMEVSAFLCPDDIPFEVINEGLPPIDDENGIADVLGDPLGRHEIISLLTEFSLFQRCGTDSFRVHRLVQEVIRGRLDKEREKLVFSCAKRFLACSILHSEKARLALVRNKYYIDLREFVNKPDETSKLCAILDEKNQESENALSCGVMETALSWLFRKKTEEKRATRLEETDGFSYDAFLIFCWNDQEWVNSELLPLLEEKYGFKCCVSYRDFELGLSIPENWCNSIQNSRKVISVVSNSLFASLHCKFELDQAKVISRLIKKNDNCLIVIKMDNATIYTMPFMMTSDEENVIDFSNKVERETGEFKLIRALKSN